MRLPSPDLLDGLGGQATLVPRATRRMLQVRPDIRVRKAPLVYWVRSDHRVARAVRDRKVSKEPLVLLDRKECKVPREM